MFHLLLSLLLALLVSAIGVQSLECYSCDTDLTDLDCNNLTTLPKQVCQNVSDYNLVSMSCGYKRVQVGNQTEKIFRGCMVAGECNLLNRQSELTSKYRMLTCVECRSDKCNEMRSGTGPVGFQGTAGSFLLLISIAAILKDQIM
ncbi:uncharacterized protein LOC134220396 [Armigeres subalbatus]|uniref:uncharacterized protein LOC134220396 n=1 Tax=Armigeres subalbatus TaxID=124917 RepID=UPI002ED593A7